MEESQEIQQIGLRKYTALMESVNNDFAELLLLSESKKKIVDRCLDPDLESIWEMIWEKMNAEPTYQEAQKNSSFRYRPLKHQAFLAPFYRVAGLHYFHRGSRPGHRELLLKAAAPPYSSFHALRALSEELIKLEKGDGYHFALALNRANTAAAVHHAPGYILLAETHFDIACYYNKTNSSRSRDYFEFSLKNIIIADQLQPHCANSMHNAYYGLGPKISNGFGLETTQEMLTHLIALIEKADPTIDIPSLIASAKKEALEIIREFYEPKEGHSLLFKKQRVGGF